MSVHVLDQAIVASLAPMFEEATSKGLWFFHHAPGGEELWCSPEYLKLQQSKGLLIMAPEHWELRNPMGYMKKLIANAHAVVAEYNDMAARLGFEETLELISHSSNKADER